MVLYKAICERSSKFYIGATQQTLKKCFQGHFQDVHCRLTNGTGVDSFAWFFAALWEGQPAVPMTSMLNDSYSNEILWQGNPFSYVKLFGTLVAFCVQKSAAP